MSRVSEFEEVSLGKALFVIVVLAALALIAGFLMFGNTTLGH